MIPAKKSLGQNFLKSKEALRALIEAGNIQPTDIILEVGPGKGVLTEELVKLAQKVIAVEKDDRLIELLEEKFKTEIESGKLEILNQDILEFDPRTISTTPPRGLGTPPKLGGEASTSILQTKSTTTPAAKTGIYVASRGGTVYYLPSCTASKRISEKNKIWFDTKAEAEKFGYKPAKNCPGI